MLRLHYELQRVFFAYVLVTTFKYAKSDENVFPRPEGQYINKLPSFNHLLVDKVRKQVFIGAVNRIYQLMPDLQLKSNFSTNADSNQIQNKLLTIYRDELISCDTGSKGICLVHDVSDVSKKNTRIPIPLEINEEDTYVAVITGNQEKLQLKPRDKSLLDFALVLRRDNQERFLKDNRTGLNEYDTLLIIEKGDGKMKISSYMKYPNKYFINYIYGFHFGEFTYFITILKSTSPDLRYTPTISRVSSPNQSSDHLNSEISIECKLNNDSTYDLVQAAFVNVPSFKLAKLLGINTTTEVLFVVLAQSKQFQEDASRNLEKASALCIYSLSEIEKKFIQNEKITAEESQNMVTNSISSKETRKIATSAEPVFTFDTLITAVTFTAFQDYTVAFVGTHDGHLKEMIFENSVVPILRSNVTVDEGSPVNSDLFFDWTGDHLYALTKHKLTRIKVCKPDCSSLELYWIPHHFDNKYYGRCSINNECNMKQNCSNEHFWTFCNSGKCSVIRNANPTAYSLESSYYLQFTFHPIPDFQGQLMCVFCFDYTVLCTNAKGFLQSNNSVKCNVPDIHLIPTVSLGRNDSKARISINTTENPEFAEIDYTFYDCGSYTSCASFVQPIIEHYSPNSGPIEGGTTLTLNGRYLNAGNLIEVFIDNLPCEIFASTSHEIKCKTTPSQKPLNGSITVKFNGKACTSENNSYEYVNVSTRDIQFWPQLGPYEGGTNISILCKYPNQKYKGIIMITVANALCRLHKHSCEPGQEIVCEIERDDSRRINAGPILLRMRNSIVESLQNYTFVDPKIESFWPTQGPTFGSTELLFKGQHLNAGRFVKILIDDSPCIIFANNTNEIKCFTSPCITCSKGLVNVLFDGNSRTFKSNSYRYRNTTKQDEFEIKEVLTKPRGIPAGGIKIFVQGNNLQSAVNPQFCVINTNQTIRYCSECRLSTKSQINCLSPVISEYNNTYLNQHGPQQLDYVVQMVSTTDVEKISINKTYPKFILYDNLIVEYLPPWQIDDVNKYPQHMERGYIEPQRNIIVVNVMYLTGGENSVNQLTTAAIYIGTIVVAILVLAFVAFLMLYFRNQKEIRKELRNMNSELLPMSRKIKKIKINKPTNLDCVTLDILEQLKITIEYHDPSDTVDGADSGEYEIPFDSRWEFPRTNLTLGKCLGQGEFGNVVKGKAHGILQKDVTTSVAVKMLKDTHSDSDMVDLVSEMEVMKVIGSHKNVLRLLGCCTRGGDLLIITEYASYGNLQMFLRQHHSSDVNTVATIVITERKLTDFAHQIAEGMEYLSSKKCIHRDLAARNILVFKDYVMKIADFGLTRHISNEYYYRKTKDGRLPVKWIAPEALLYGVYKTQSDVWSYGILLWEIFTLGGIPYPLSLNMEQLFQSLRSGYRMEKPHGCSSKIYSLMRDCWSYEAEDRPTFTAIVQTLGKMLENNEVRSNLYWLNNKESGYEENEYCLLENNLEENEPCLLENFLLRRHV